MSEEQYLTNNNAPPNPDLAILKQHFGQCFDKNGVFLLEKFAANLAEQAVDFSTESYGLEWLGKSYARLLASDAATTLLKADEAHNAQTDHALADNILIQGDNLEALKHLAHAYYEKVKMIYIDPPYNTGGDDFVYADDRKFTVRELQTLMGVDRPQAERILKFTQKQKQHAFGVVNVYVSAFVFGQTLIARGWRDFCVHRRQRSGAIALVDGRTWSFWGREFCGGNYLAKKKGA